MRWPHLTLYVARTMSGAAGEAQGPVIRILRERRGDRPLWLHEYEHVRQWWTTAGLHSPLYLWSRRYRAWAEARAYAAQVRAGADLATLARHMAGARYRLDLTPAEARRMIERHL